MSIRAIVGIAALIGTSVCGLLSALVHFKMVEQLNAKLPKEEQFFLVGWHAPKEFRLFREYRWLFPGKSLHSKFISLAVVAFACLICAAWAVGLF